MVLDTSHFPMRLYKIDVENLPGLGDIFHTIMFPHIYRLILHGNVLYGKAQVNISGWSLIMCWMQLAHKETVHFRLNCWRLFQKNGKGSPIWKHALQVRSDISNSMNIIIYCNICKPVIICKKKSLLRGGKMQGWFWQVVKSVAQLHLLHTNHPQKTKNGTQKKILIFHSYGYGISSLRSMLMASTLSDLFAMMASCQSPINRRSKLGPLDL